MRKTVLSVLLVAALLLTLSGCASVPASLAGDFVACPLEGAEKCEYVFAVSKNSPNAAFYLEQINQSIRELDVVALAEKYATNTVHRVDFLGEIFLNDNKGESMTVYTISYKPFQFSGAYGNGIDGLDLYILAHMAERNDMKIAFNDLAYDFCYDAVKSGKGDVFASAVVLTDRIRQDFLVSDVYLTGSQQIVSDQNQAFTKLEQLKGLTIGVVTGRPGEVLVKDAVASGVLKNSGATVMEYFTDTEAQDALDAQIVDVLVLDELPAKLIAEKI